MSRIKAHLMERLERDRAFRERQEYEDAFRIEPDYPEDGEGPHAPPKEPVLIPATFGEPPF